MKTVESVTRLVSCRISFKVVLLDIVVAPKNSDFGLLAVVCGRLCVPGLVFLCPVLVLFVVSSLTRAGEPPFSLPRTRSRLMTNLLARCKKFTFTTLCLTRCTFIRDVSLLSSLLFFNSSCCAVFFVFLFV